MRKALLLLLVLAVAGLGVYTNLGGGPGAEPDPDPGEATTAQGPTEPVPGRAEPPASRLPTLPDTSDWKRHRTRGGIFEFPVPPGWYCRDMPDPRDAARIHTGFLVSASREDPRTGLYWYPFFPLYSSGSPEIKRLLDAKRIKKPGMIIYQRSDMKSILMNLRWAYHPVCSARKFVDALVDPWFGDLFLRKCGCPRPHGFALPGPVRVARDLIATGLTFKLGRPGSYKEVEGLCWLSTSRPVPGRGGWGAWMLFLQSAKGEWERHMPTLWAILAGVRYDREKHLEIVGEARSDEVGLLRRVVDKVQREDLRQRWSQIPN